MEIVPATLLATNPFAEPTRIPLSAMSAAERTVNHISWKKQIRLPTSTKRRSSFSSSQGRTSQYRQDHYQDYQHHHPHSGREKRAEFRPLGSLSKKQLTKETRSANEELKQVRRDAGIYTPPKAVPGEIGIADDDFQLPKIDDTPKTGNVSPPKSIARDTEKVTDSVTEKLQSESGFQRVGRQGYSRVDMVKTLQKHKKCLSASAGGRTATTAKGDRRQRIAASKVESVCWGNSEGIVKGRSSVKGSSSSSPTSSDDDSSSRHSRERIKISPASDKWATPESDVAVQSCKSATCRLPQVNKKSSEAEIEVDLSMATLEDVILAKLEDEVDKVDGELKEHRVPWEGKEVGYSPDVLTCSTRPTTSGNDGNCDGRAAMRSEVATPELSDGALSNDEEDRRLHSAKNKHRTMKLSSPMLQDMRDNFPSNNSSYGDDIAKNIMKKLQPPTPHVIWPDNRFLTTDTVFVYGSPSRLAPVIVPSHSVDCPLCNFYTPSAYGEICPPNSPTLFLKKDYGFYPVERFYSDF